MKDNSADLKLKFFSNIPLGIAILATFVTVFILESLVLKETGGVFIYPLDDPFIHMQIAKNLAFYNTWGINQHEFGSASSSILYTLLLAGIFKLFSVNVLVPFIINCIAALFLLVSVDVWLKKQLIGARGRTVIFIFLIFFTPLTTLIISGMEHTLQCLFSFLFLTRFSDWLEQIRNTNNKKKWRLPWIIIVYAVLVTTVRYEGLFLVAIACLLLLYYRKAGIAFALGFMALLPVIIFGIYSVIQGSYFLPNSVLVKSNEIHFSLKGIIEFLNNTLIYKLTIVKEPLPESPGIPPPGISLLATQRLLIILPIIGLLFIRQIKQKLSFVYMLIILVLCTLLHLSFAATGWFYRYEAYLIMCAVVLVAVVIYKYRQDFLTEKLKYTRIFTSILLFALLFPLILRSAAAYSKTKQACINIYQQQYQMAQFFKRYYNEDVVAANDIGAISYYSNTKIVDLWGLGSIDVARSKKSKYWTPAFLDSFVKKKNVKLAVVYDEWFEKELLSRWTKVAAWEMNNNVIAGGNTVSFYVIDSEYAKELKENLHDYQKYLPHDIRIVYFQ